MYKLFYLALLLNSLFVFSQNYKVTYQIKYNIDLDTIKDNNRRIEYRNFLNDLSESYGVLHIQKNVAMFKQQGKVATIGIPDKPFLRTNFYSSNSKIIITENNTNGLNNWYYTFDDLHWELTTESKKINNFTCYKAIGYLNQRGYIKGLKKLYVLAWYSPDIALPFGPKFFAGLPGLVFEGQYLEGKGEFFTLISIEKNKAENFDLPKNIDHYEVYMDKLVERYNLIFK